MQADHVDVVLDDPAALVPVLVAKAEANVVPDGEPGKDAAFLEDEDAPRIGSVDRLAFHQHLALRGGEEAADDVEQGRFAAAGGADEADELALLDFEVDPFQHVDGFAAARAGECHPQVADDDGRMRRLGGAARGCSVMADSIRPLHRLEAFHLPHQQVQEPADQPDHDHARHDQIIAFAGVAGVDDQVAEPGVDGDHLGGDDDQPGDAQRDPQTGDDLRQRGRQDHAAEQLQVGQAEVLRRPQMDRLHALARPPSSRP